MQKGVTQTQFKPAEGVQPKAQERRKRSALSPTSPMSPLSPTSPSSPPSEKDLLQDGSPSSSSSSNHSSSSSSSLIVPVIDEPPIVSIPLSNIYHSIKTPTPGMNSHEKLSRPAPSVPKISVPSTTSSSSSGLRGGHHTSGGVNSFLQYSPTSTPTSTPPPNTPWHPFQSGSNNRGRSPSTTVNNPLPHATTATPPGMSNSPATNSAQHATPTFVAPKSVHSGNKSSSASAPSQPLHPEPPSPPRSPPPPAIPLPRSTSIDEMKQFQLPPTTEKLFGSTGITKDSTCFVCKQKTVENGQEHVKNVVLAINLDGIHVVKPFLETVFVQYPWRIIKQWSWNSTCFFLMIQQQYETTILFETLQADEILKAINAYVAINLKKLKEEKEKGGK